MQAISANQHLDSNRRISIEIDRKTWYTVIAFMVSMSLVGLCFYPAILIVVAIMCQAYRRNRYDFVIMVLLFCGNYGLTSDSSLPVKLSDIAFLVSIVLFFIYKKKPIVRASLAILAAYAAILLIFALLSVEVLKVQLLMMRGYLAFVFFIIPIVAFSRHQFDINTLWQRLFPFVFVACAFYIIDAYILCGNFLMPGTFIKYQPTIFHPIWNPLSFDFVRKYPQGLFPMILLVYPVARYYKLAGWQWGLVIMALISTLTFSFLIGIIFTYLLFRFDRRRMIIGLLAGVILASFLYYVDGMLPQVQRDEIVESKLRIKSSIDQIISLTNLENADEEELANLASGRIGQAIPKLDLVQQEGRSLIGLGFLHPDLNTVRRYVIINDLYISGSTEEVAAEIEMVPLQIYLNIGILGLLFHILFFVALWLLIKRLKYSFYFISVLIGCVLFGIGGFCSLARIHGLFIAAFAYACVVLANSNSERQITQN